MTVDQRGENVLFVHVEGKLEAHVQVSYQGDPARFAWLVPMPEEPEVRVGSQALFDALLEGTAPVYGIRTTTMRCDGTEETTESQGCGTPASAGPTIAGVGSTRDDASEMMDPIGKTVGSFDVTFLRPTRTEEVTKWLTDNAFQLPSASAERLDPYVKSGAVFVAIKLAPGQGVQDIHPIVFRYAGTRPGIPLRLTAVAATPDMRVRTFFLDRSRVVPSNFYSVTLNDVKLDWPTFASDYEAVVGSAVDETGSGLGFVTEFAGATDEVDSSRVHDPRWDAAAFEGLDPFQALAELQRQGQIDCESGPCRFPHPLVLPLLQRYVPAPAGASESAFYRCLECNREQVDLAAWDAAAFAAEYQERVVAPAAHAATLLREQPYLTRMLTFLSPEEMTADPVFHAREGLPEVARERWAERTVPCSGPSTLDLPDGRHVVEGGLFSWVGRTAGMPSAERIELVAEDGAADVLLDASAEIDALVDDSNAGAPRGGSGSGAGVDRVRAEACSVRSPLAQHGAWLALPCLYLAARRRRR